MNTSIIPDATATTQYPKVDFATVRESARRAGLVVAHLITPDVAIVPSATAAGETYVLTLTAGNWRCNCLAGEDGGATCWHGKRAQELIAARGQQDTPNPPVTNPPPAPPSDTHTRYLAARSDLYGDWAA